MGLDTDFRSFIASSLAVSAIFDILGQPSAGNQVVYAAWPQQRVQLGTPGSEPAQGWISFRIDDFVRQQDILDFKDVYIDSWATQPLILSQVKDVTDDLFHHKLAGQNGISTSSFDITFSQLRNSLELYEDDLHLYRRQTVYQFRVVARPFGT